MAAYTESLRKAWADLSSQALDKWNSLTPKQQTVAAAVGGVSSVYLLAKLVHSRSYRRSPTSFELTGGSIAADKVKSEFDAYANSYGAEAGTGIVDRSQTVHLVDVFYSLVTDIYEWGWGQSFHFSPKLPMKDWGKSESAHEARIAALLGLRPGMKCLDCGCGVGGPMRTIAAVSGATVVGITINEYQVQRAKHHNEKQGVSPLTQVVRGDFTNMPFENNTFDGAYAIEATCHAPKLEMVYGEIYRVLKPGAKFVSYEWVSTHKFDANNPQHVKVIDEINFGNGLPEMRTYKEAEQAGKNVGFDLVTSYDLATASPVCGAWYESLSFRFGRLKVTEHMHHVNHAIVSVMDFIGLAPKGMKQVHKMLVDVARSLVAGGESGVFSPMHMLVFQKPAK